MKAIKITITSFISNDQPGVVECKLIDAWNKEHILQDKVPIFTKRDLDENSEYPQGGVVGCEVLKISTDADYRTIFTVTTDRPWGVESLDGLTEFDVLEEQIIEI